MLASASWSCFCFRKFFASWPDLPTTRVDHSHGSLSPLEFGSEGLYKCSTPLSTVLPLHPSLASFPFLFALRSPGPASPVR